MIAIAALLIAGADIGRADPPLGMDPSDLSVPAGSGGSSRSGFTTRSGGQVRARGKLPQRKASEELPGQVESPTEFAPAPVSLPPSASVTPAVSLAPGAISRWGVSTGLGFPHPFFLEGEYLRSFASAGLWSFGLGLGGMHVQNVTLDSAPLELNMLAADARARWHPWAGSFFVGAALGIQKFNAAVAITTPVTQGSQTYDVYSLAKVDLTSLYLTPHVGWFKVYDNGLILGIDVGIQVPVGVRKSFDTTTDASSLEQIDVTNVEDTPQYKQKRAEAEDAVDTLGKLPMPYFTLIRVGWMF